MRNKAWSNLKKQTFAIVVMWLVVHTGWAQHIRLSGQVMDGEANTPIEFVNVVLQMEDSTFMAGTTTDPSGHFRLDKLAKGDYRLMVSSIGYIGSVVDLRGLSGSLDLGEVTLRPDAVTLEDVTVTAANIINKADRKVIFPSERQVSMSSNGANLLQSMMLPRLEVNALTNAISLANNGALQLRINGVEAGGNEIVALRPADIIRVEYIENPGLRYGNVDVVLNYVTRRHESGGFVSLDLMNSPHILMGEDLVAMRMNHKKSEFGLSYSLSTRDFHKMWRNNTEVFRFDDGSEIIREESGKPGQATRQDHHFVLNYNYQSSEQAFFNVRFRYDANIVPHNNDYFSDLRSNDYPGRIVAMSDLNDLRTHTPSLDLYYMRTLAHKQTLVCNLVGTSIRTDRNRTYQERLGETYLTDVSSGINGKKYSVIAEGIYEREFTPGRLGAGIRHTHSFSDNTYTGTTPFLTRMWQADTYLYTEFSGKVKRLDYTAGVGITCSWLRQEGESDYETYVFRPRVTLRYAFSKNVYARLGARIENAPPSLSDLSAVEQWIDSIQIQKGNPGVLPYKQYTIDLYAEYRLGKFLFSGSAIYMNAPNAIMETTYQRDKVFVHTVENQRRMQRLNSEVTVKAGMFWNILQLSLTGGVNRYWSDGHTYSHRYTNWYYRAQVMAMYKKWMLVYAMRSNSNRFWGETLRGGENMVELFVMYRHKNITLGLGALNPFMDDFKVDNERWNRNTAYKRTNYINESSRAFILKFAWNFTFGRTYQSTPKKLNNQDHDAGVMSVGK